MNIKLWLFFLLVSPVLAIASPLEIYSHLTQKTLLLAPGLPQINDSVAADLPSDPPQAIATMEKAFGKLGIAVVQDGMHFIRLLTEGARESHLAEVPLRGDELTPSENIALGAIHFSNADLNQVLRLYADLSQRNVLRPAALSHGPIYLKTARPLARKTAVYGLDTLLAMHGIAMVNDGDFFVQAVPGIQRPMVKAQAPIRDLNATLLDPRNAADTPNSAKPDSPAAREFKRLQEALSKLMDPKGPSTVPAFRLLELYAEIAGKTAMESAFDAHYLSFRITAPLTKAELLYAIETTIRLHNLSITNEASGKVRLEHIRSAAHIEKSL